MQLNIHIKFFLAVFLLLGFFSFFGPFYGDYCVGDDCTYSKVIKTMFFEGKFDPNTVESPIFSHYFAGMFFSFLFGFSHLSLRLSVMFLSIALFVSLYFFFSRAGLKQEISVLCAGIVSFNPLVFSLSHSFMTDVPSLLWIVLSSYFFLGWIESEKRTDFFLGLIFSGIAIFTRSFSFFVLFAVLGVIFIDFIRKKKIMKFETIFLIAFIFLTVLLVSLFTFSVLETKESYFGFGLNTTNLSRFFGIPVYLGFSFIGILVFFVQRLKENNALLRKSLISLFLIAGALIALLFIPLHPLMPYYGNILSSEGLGYISLDGEKEFFFEPFWPLLTVVSLLCAFVLIDVLLSQKFSFFLSRKNSFLSLCFVFYFLMMISFNYFYDRFIILLLPFALVLFVLSLKNSPFLRPALLISLLFLAVFSYYGTTDYFLWRNSAEKGIDFLNSNNVELQEIKGHYEFCSFVFDSPDQRKVCSGEAEGKYILSFSIQKDCKKSVFEDSFIFFRQKIYVLECSSFNEAID